MVTKSAARGDTGAAGDTEGKETGKCVLGGVEEVGVAAM